VAFQLNIESNFVAIETIADADVYRPQSWRNCRIAFAQVPVAHVLDDEVADDA
jgi:hypothetical protein